VFIRSSSCVVGLVLTLTVFIPPSSANAQSFFDTLKSVADKVAPSIAIPGLEKSDGNSALSLGDITSGLKEALRVGTERVVNQIGTTDGYNKDSAIHIPLPKQLHSVHAKLKKFGLSSLTDDLELKLNRAAEAAAPKAKQILWVSVTEMTLDDAKAIYNGPADAATQYFKRVSSDSLRETIKPIVDDSLADVGALTSYDSLMGKYKNLPFVPDVTANLSQHTVDLALQGIFHYLAKEEEAIRQDPAKRTTELLTKVFGK
jgi:hypothetical protein